VSLLRYLLDTNVVSEPPRPAPNPKTLQKLLEHEGEVAIAAVVWHEMLFGVERLPPSQKRSALEAYLFQIVRPVMPILPYNRAAAEWHARQRARLTATGKPPAFQDGQIAAIARVNHLILVTANRVHFEVFDGLSIEDWS
jgi:tRNA(fMet)-specific endonuclease VapC